jgi:multidrug efflux pump subunit AcrB
MPKKMEDSLREFTTKVFATVAAALIITVATSIFVSSTVMPMRLDAVEKQTEMNTKEIKCLQEDTNAKITKIYELLLSQKH